MKHQSLFVKALKQADSKDEAFTRLVQEYKERLYWHIRKIVLDHDDANDVVQNTFIKVHLNIENFNENSTLFTWMYRIATNEAFRRGGREAQDSDGGAKDGFGCACSSTGGTGRGAGQNRKFDQHRQSNVL